MWHDQWKKIVTRALVVTLAFPATFVAGFATAPVAHGFDVFAQTGSVILNEIVPAYSGGVSVVELANTSASAQDISGWTISDASGQVYSVTDGTTIAANGFFTVNGSSGSWTGSQQPFATAGDTVTLKNASGSVLSTVSYGNSLSAHIVSPTAGLSLAWSAGHWYSNAVPTVWAATAAQGVANTSIVNPPLVPTGASVAASGLNSANTISAGSQSNVSITVAAAGLDITDSVTARLYDTTGQFVGHTDSANASGTVTVSSLNASTLNDGSTTVRVYASNTNGVNSAYVTGTSATKDTVLPSTPSITTPPTAGSRTNAASFQVMGTVTEPYLTIKAFADATNDGVADSATPVATVSGGNGKTFGIFVPLVSNSVNHFVITATDAAGNESAAATVPAITHDSTAPAAPAWISTSTGTNGKVTISFAPSTSADVASYQLFSDNRTGSVDYAAPIATITSPSTSFTTDVLANGLYRFSVRAVDTAGNVDQNTNTASAMVNGPLRISTDNPYFGDGLALSASGAHSFTTLNDGSTIPHGSAPSGVTFLPQYFEVTATPAATSNNPVLIRFYYTASQLSAANVKEASLQGVYYYDSASNSWKLYSSTGASTTDVTGPDGVRYAGYVWANADHLTPIAFGAGTATVTTASVTSRSIGSGTAVSTSNQPVTSATGSGSTTTSNQPSSSSSTNTTPASPTSNDQNGQVKASETSNANQNRLFITLLILVIAAGAGAAGYYGYQWWSERPTPKPVEPKPAAPAAKPTATAKKPSKPSGKAKGGRW